MKKLAFSPWMVPVELRYYELSLSGYECYFHADQYHDGLYQSYGVDLPTLLDKATPKRKAEFLAGRLCAQNVLQRLSLPYGTNALHTGEQRGPVWPDGIRACISHTDNYAICIATRSPTVCGIGVDVEKIMSAEVIRDVHAQILDSMEVKLVASNFTDFSVGLTVAFSAKESIYKALHPSVGSFFDFCAVRACWIDEARIAFRVVDNLSSHIQSGLELVVSYVRDGDIVRTYCAHVCEECT